MANIPTAIDLVDVDDPTVAFLTVTGFTPGAIDAIMPLAIPIRFIQFIAKDLT